MAIPESFPCLMVRRDQQQHVRCSVEEITVADLPAGEVLIEVAASSLNYKDALATQGHPGVVRHFPHIPGIDCAGKVVASEAAEFQPNDQVLVTGYELGSGRWGGYSQFVRVPAEWVVPMLPGLTCDSAMAYGTAGFTAAQCVRAILAEGIRPERGEVVVTGASGGVGTVAIALLAKLDFTVVAVTGKPDLAATLKHLGAARVIPREEVVDTSDNSLLPVRWAAAVDTVGGNTLATLLRSTEHRGCVAACGLVGGHELPLTVYPFILRGVKLAGIDSAKCPREPRLEVWQRLAGDWNVADQLKPLIREVTLPQLAQEVALMLAGNNHGRILVRPRA